MPHQAVKGMMPWCTACSMERWLNFFRSSVEKLPDAPPGSEGHDAVVHHMQRREVTELLAQDKEDGVQVVHVLAEEIPPRHVQGIEPILQVCEIIDIGSNALL